MVRTSKLIINRRWSKINLEENKPSKCITVTMFLCRQHRGSFFVRVQENREGVARHKLPYKTNKIDKYQTSLLLRVWDTFIQVDPGFLVRPTVGIIPD